MLKWVLASHKRQFYIGANVTTGLKKPLDAFLGELFLWEWEDGETLKCVTEQVRYSVLSKMEDGTFVDFE